MPHDRLILLDSISYLQIDWCQERRLLCRGVAPQEYNQWHPPRQDLRALTPVLTPPLQLLLKPIRFKWGVDEYVGTSIVAQIYQIIANI